jgi:hypothetical protein
VVVVVVVVVVGVVMLVVSKGLELEIRLLNHLLGKQPPDLVVAVVMVPVIPPPPQLCPCPWLWWCSWSASPWPWSWPPLSWKGQEDSEWPPAGGVVREGDAKMGRTTVAAGQTGGRCLLPDRRSGVRS